MDRVNDIANRYVDEWAVLDPTGATHAGIAGYDDRMTDLSPAGYAALADLDRRTLAQLDAAVPTDERERVAKEAMQERLGRSLALYDAGDITSQVNVIASGLHYVRGVFDLMPTSGEEAAANIATRLAAVPGALAQWRQTLLHAADQGSVSSRQQMIEVAKQCDIWTDPAGDNFYPALAERVSAGVSEALRADLSRAADRAREATVETGRFLREELARRGREKQAAGPERYKRAIDYFLGADVDVHEAYAWGFDELTRLEADLRQMAEKIVPGGSVDDAVEALDAEPARNITGKEAFRDWMQELADRAIRELHGVHFDIPEQVRRIECCLAPTSDGSIYYTGPSEDFSRPGRMWWAVPQGIDTFSTWREVTTVYHEGVPGHHLQIGQTAVRAELLNRWQRLLCWCSGHGEGWALYAERLMDELGYLADPGDKLGMLDAQTFRAARVIVDIGMHLELEIPRDNPFGFHPGERWTPELGWEFMRAHCRVPDENLRFEVNRYLGWAGQAPAYKIGERIWLQARADARARKGADFDLRAFHRDALNLGSLGLDPLKAALARV
ncbi:DUF885 domain-containing protein [Planosporangium flavigriseum]|uniref:DUF885 domain-containing protein n=1 Tax=Planosporangium flavigriseum TaxID=373681 RepID=A0A8J3LYW1_9ACTN|nr:DUF885 domain-containing protein [Planosporangium flavigriseum]NJC66809.1 DUF885 domain-containing protein [Planosporangium flavigriseum]GIG76299.1 hypothetical protein Pfl04_47030 [Planosporangium flavigriseum]